MTKDNDNDEKKAYIKEEARQEVSLGDVVYYYDQQDGRVTAIVTRVLAPSQPGDLYESPLSLFVILHDGFRFLQTVPHLRDGATRAGRWSLRDEKPCNKKEGAP
jgi:hypothetical protein